MGANSHVVARSREVRESGPELKARATPKGGEQNPQAKALSSFYGQVGPAVTKDLKNARATGGLP
jgi:hypothetical protein